MASTPERTIGHEHHGVDEEKGLHRTTTMVTMPPEMFEKVDIIPAPSSVSYELLTERWTVLSDSKIPPCRRREQALC